MRIFLTGGTGFVGRRVAALLRERGDDVVILARTPSKAQALRDAGCEVVAGDLSSDAAIRRGLEGADAAIHAGADYRIGVPRSQAAALHEANVRGTERVLDAAVDAGVARIVYVSTGNVFGNTRTGRMKLLMSGDFMLDYVHVDDLAEGVVLALDRGRVGEAYVLGGERASMRDLVETVAELSGRRPPRAELPAALLRASAPLGPLVGPLLGFPPNLAELIRTTDGVTILTDDAKARRELGYRTRPLREGLRETLDQAMAGASGSRSSAARMSASPNSGSSSDPAR